MLDLNGDDFPTIVDEIVDHLMESRVLHKECSSKVRTLLLKKHRHSTEDTTIWEKLKHSATGGWGGGVGGGGGGGGGFG